MQNDIFQAVLDNIEHPVLEIRKEVFFILGHVMTCLPTKHVKELLQYHETLLGTYLKGLSLISHPQILLSILDTVDHLG